MATKPTTPPAMAATAASLPTPAEHQPQAPQHCTSFGPLGFSSGGALIGLFQAARGNLSTQQLQALAEHALTHVKLLADAGESIAGTLGATSVSDEARQEQTFGMAEMFSQIGGMAYVASEAAFMLEDRQRFPRQGGQA